MNLSDLYSLGNQLTAANSNTFNPETSWQICTIVLGAIVTAALFIFFTYFKKGAEKRKPAEDVKNFFLFKGNFAEDLARICFYYVSFTYLMNGLKTLTTYGQPWAAFETFFYLVFIRFVYEAAIAIIRFCKGKKD
ncbi:hypothetical protein IKT64_01895 [Candidatus Saccharibacteria bacterium]|nr:hypothetical protein [Candidatus Saccharibacteria bacterium]